VALKDWSVEAFFPEVRPAHLADQRVTVRASSLGTAARVGLDVIRDRDAMRGKKITTARITVRLIAPKGESKS
jgi:hypothetical protein